ncbi:MAG TPA: chromosome segregation protein SMC, partial [Clostridia bacterium]
MYLKKLEVQGFKSFADKIGLDFNSGVTSVVGPNGSGKSNIADSVRWVLGEQSAKTLRGSKMEDVIFAGTEHRKPMGFAEVTLVIDNSEKALAVEYSEVSVSRRVYRSGESEYYINKTPCRLKDIHELFLDTGIGRDGYSIIGQGRVDEILSSRSEDRRNIFEEASGIMKFKVRKQEAEKKLEQTEQNLMRINDIINELSTQIEPLKQQSEVARRYLTLRETLKELEINVYIENISKLKEKINEFEEQYSSLKKDIEDEQKKLDEITSKNQDRTELIKSIEERLEASRQYFYTIEGNIEKSGSELRVNEEKIANLEKDNLRIEKEINEEEIKLKELIDDKASKTAKMEELEKKLGEFQENLKAYENQMKELISTLNENEQQIEAMKSQIMDKLDIQTDKKTQLANSSTHLENLKRRRGSISNEVYQLALEKDREVIKREEFKDSISKVEGEIKYSLGKLGELRNEKSQLEKDLERFTQKLNSVKSDIQVKLSRQKILKDLEKNLEGYSRSVKEILQACSRRPELGQGILGALAQLLKVDARYETAIEMSLGGALQNIVTNTEEDAKKAIEYLKANRLGRATFLPISAVKGKSFDSSMLGRIRGHEGFCGVASDLVTYGENLDGIVQSLLGKVVVVENLEYGIKMAKSFGYSFRIVTLEGDILSTSGSMSGGSTDSRGPGILSRNREITELSDNIEVLKKSEIELEDKNIEIVTMLKEVASEVFA